MTIPLRELLSAAGLPADDVPGVQVTGIAYDSRNVRPGFVFVAIPGEHTDGHAHAASAVANGAVAVVALDGRDAVPTGAATVVRVADTRAALAPLSAAFYGYPARRLRVAGITGTDGKTTTSYLATAVLDAGGARTGMITTVDFKVGERWEANNSRQTTPEALENQAMLRQMVDANCDWAVIESTSHGLALHRLDGCEYDVAVLTNITSDHLDFHETREAYIEAKSRLFEMLDAAAAKGIAKTAILNLDDPASAYLRTKTRAQVLTYALDQAADITAADVQAGEAGTSFTLATPAGRAPVLLALPARYNVANALAAAGVGVAQGLAAEVIATGLSALKGVPGRMERIDEGQPFTVIVDYAHTEESLRNVLRVLRPLTKGRLMVLFGAAGDRDPGRRTGLGAAAADLADFAILANEDPREEDEWKILRDIGAALEAGGRRENEDYLAIPDRRDAIAEAFRRARPGDLVLLAGKGHEQSIIVSREKTPWDDRAVAREELRRLVGTERG